ncbi:MaoC family dehydratase [Candidatus Pacearchaeota archaeon]|nr:MaoC family dehydratase [Candidatus Pacearchaeota archaeon]
MEKINVSMNAWMKYADAVGDTNPIHRDVTAAKKAKLEDVVAPGMYLAAHFQGDSRIREAEFCFKKPVYDGDEISKEECSFYKDDDLVCKGNIVLGKPTNRIVPLPKKIAYSNDFSATESKIEDFLDSIKFSSRRFSNPEMYLMALSAPALLEYAKSKRLGGVHAYQSIEICKSFDLRKISIAVGEESIHERLCKLDLYWTSGDGVVAVGKAKVLPVSI